MLRERARESALIDERDIQRREAYRRETLLEEVLRKEAQLHD